MSTDFFASQAWVYDDRHVAFLPAAAAEQLLDVSDLAPGARILDVGVGTGRVAIPIARLGRHVWVVDQAQAMLQVLREKAAGALLPTAAAHAERLPFASRSFEAVVVARLLYLTADWREVLREAARVLESGGRLLHEWGNGNAAEAWVQIREKARDLFERAGVPSPFHPGARREADVREFLTGEGWSLIDEVHLEPDLQMTLGVFLDRIEAGKFSYTWKVPADVQRECLPQLRTWATGRFDLDRPVDVPREQSWQIYARG